MNKIEFKSLKEEQKVITFNQLKDDYSNLFAENTNLKQALNDIREYFNEPQWEEHNLPPTSHCLAKDDILQIIDKVLGD